MPTSDLLNRAVAKVIPKDLAKQKLKSGRKLRIYWGIDPTTPELHLGHTVPMRKLKSFANAGHHVILVIGSFTAMIGDPSDRDAARKPLTREEVERNFQTYKQQASRVLDFSTIDVRYNHEWLAKLSFEDIARLASHFTVQQMTERAMFFERMNKGKPVYMHEFLYPLLVGYDSVVLDVDGELGGTDQEFNMLCGRNLQTASGKRDKFVLTTHLIPGLDGRKMSKTYGNCIYLTDPPGEMFGKIMSLDDTLVPLYMECCTDLEMSEVKEAVKVVKSGGRGVWDLKAKLARTVVSGLHSPAEAKRAEEEFQKVFREKGTPDDIPTFKAKKGMTIVDILVAAGLASSKSEARRLIDQGGVKINGKMVKSESAEIEEEATMRVGKRKFLSVHFQ